MFKVHAFVDNRKIIQWRMQHIPAKGDIVRIAKDAYFIVAEVIWCLDEESTEGQRVNLALEPVERTE